MISLPSVRNLLIGAVLIAAPSASFASVGVFISVGIAPPPLPVYVQPPLPAEGYIWTPGYWAYGPEGYYWVPGVWVQPPTVGVLWTPGYWGFVGGQYRWNAGYWGPHIGFYGGVNYGFGYIGHGYEGGTWVGGRFTYNTAVNNFGGVHVSNTYVRNVTVINNNYAHTSFAGGPNGVPARPTPQESQAMNERHFGATPNQEQFRQQAANNPAQRFSANHGRPGVMAAASTRDGFGHANEVNARQGNQQERINQGVRSGQLTPGETRNLETRDTSINRQAQADRRVNGGALTPQERQQINQRQNNVSNSINRDDHNANNDRTAAARNGAAPRQERQQAEHVEHNNAPHPHEDHPKGR
jgi:hypothetical protein